MQTHWPASLLDCDCVRHHICLQGASLFLVPHMFHGCSEALSATPHSVCCRALDSPEGPHKGIPECLALRHSLVLALLDKGLTKVISELQDLAQEPIFTVSTPTEKLRHAGL